MTVDGFVEIAELNSLRAGGKALRDLRPRGGDYRELRPRGGDYREFGAGGDWSTIGGEDWTVARSFGDARRSRANS